MTIKQTKDGNKLTISVEGNIDTNTSPQLGEVVKTSLNGIKFLTFDFAKVEYISAAGLRVLLQAQKIMDRQGEMYVKNVCENVMTVFELTAFDQILTIK